MVMAAAGVRGGVMLLVGGDRQWPPLYRRRVLQRQQMEDPGVPVGPRSGRPGASATSMRTRPGHRRPPGRGGLGRSGSSPGEQGCRRRPFAGSSAWKAVTAATLVALADALDPQARCPAGGAGRQLSGHPARSGVAGIRRGDGGPGDSPVGDAAVCTGLAEPVDADDGRTFGSSLVASYKRALDGLPRSPRHSR